MVVGTGVTGKSQWAVTKPGRGSLESTEERWKRLHRSASLKFD